MSNIKFNYLYRDGSNYKQWGAIIFSNEGGLTVDAVMDDLRNCFLKDGLFIAHQIRVPNLFLTHNYPPTADDHCYHEFDKVEVTSDPQDDQYRRSIRTFIDEAARESKRGWRAFFV